MLVEEIALYSAVAIAASAIAVSWGGAMGKWRWLLAAALVYLASMFAFFWTPGGDPELAAQVPTQRAIDGYASSDTCRSCHAEHYESWHRSYHRTMTQLASPETVLANVSASPAIEHDGRTYGLEWRRGALWARLPDPELEADAIRRGAAPSSSVPMVDRRIVMTTGSHHYQAYWVRGSRGRELRQFPFVYLLPEKRFIPREDAFLQPPDAPRHLVRWNSNCVQCHAVAGRPAHDLASDAFETEAVELGIACESCHGPGQRHIERHRSPLERRAARADEEADPSIVHPLRLDAAASAEVCGQCHSYFMPKDERTWWERGFSGGYRAGDRLSDSRRVFDYARDRLNAPPALARTLDSAFWPDGTIRVGGREYNGLVASPCFERGKAERQLTCTSCHSLHESEPDDQLGPGMRGNAACLACHDGSLAAEGHTHHPSTSAGSLCYNCHMPHTSYALFKGIRSHRITNPRVRTDGAAGAPNACNLCHLDRSLDWTAQHLSSWYGQPMPASTPESGDKHAPVAAAVEWLLSGDAAERVVLASRFGWKDAHVASGSDWQAPFLAELLDDPYAAVRFVAHRAIKTLPGFEKFEADPVGAPEARAESRAKALATYEPKTKSPNAERAFPLDERRHPDPDTLAALKRARDNRPVTISE